MSGGSSREGTEQDSTCAAKDCQCQAKEIEEMNKYPERPKTVMSRKEVYRMIDTERDYQDWKQRHWDDSKWSINDWVVFIERYLQEIKDWTGHPREQMDAMRKVGALAVVAMEFNGTRPRENGYPKK